MLDLEIEHLPVETLIPYARNARTHSDEQISQIAGSITEFGFVNPILIGEDNVIIAGHGRLMAAQRLGLPTVPVIMLAHLSETQRRALVLADNKIAENAGWDEKLLSLELLALQDDHFDLSMIGFSDEEISDLLQDENTGEELTDPDDVPEAPANPVTQSGDIWLLGKHRLMCGDSTSIDAVEKLMAGAKADLLLTDPPYNVAYEGKTSDALTIKNDCMNNDDFRQFLRDVYFVADIVMRPGAVFYIWHGDFEGFNFRGAAHDVGWKIRQCLIWSKNIFVLGRQDYHSKHEPCLYGWKDGAAHYWGNDRSQTTVMNFNKPTRNGEHPTMKPVELFQYQIENSTKKGQIVLDLFGGSGTTIIAAEKSVRTAHLMELDPKYCDVIIKRWQEFTGKKAILESKGQSFDDIELQKQEAPLLEGV